MRFGELSYGEKVKDVYKIFGDPDSVVQHDLAGTLGMRIIYSVTDIDELSVVYNQKSKRIEMIMFPCTIAAWVEERLRDGKVGLLCSHESVVLAKWGQSLRRDGQHLYNIPGDKGAVRLNCPDKNLNVCDWVEIHWWRR